MNASAEPTMTSVDATFSDVEFMSASFVAVSVASPRRVAIGAFAVEPRGTTRS